MAVAKAKLTPGASMTKRKRAAFVRLLASLLLIGAVVVALIVAIVAG